ncbi:MAG: hypothetical protein IJK41_09945 [Muribaculaceae bacterium]|nr:hypothetical protein [Muribaculaceae bacterium]
MKRISILIAVMTLVALPVLAQSGLNINALFDGRYKTNPYAAEYIVTGPAAWDIDLEVYHSLKVTQKEQQELIESLVNKDGATAVDKEVQLRNGKLYYGFYTLSKTKKGRNRYIFFLNQNLAKKTPKNMVTLIYMEGKATPTQIKKLIRK